MGPGRNQKQRGDRFDTGQKSYQVTIGGSRGWLDGPTKLNQCRSARPSESESGRFADQKYTHSRMNAGQADRPGNRGVE